MAVVGEPVGATILGWIWLGEAVGPVVLAGCAVTLCSVILSFYRADAVQAPDEGKICNQSAKGSN